MLAMALFLEKYMKSSINPAERDKIESAWLLRWKERLGNPSRLPQKVMRMYLEDMDITSDDLDAQMVWKCWPATNKIEDFGDLDDTVADVRLAVAATPVVSSDTADEKISAPGSKGDSFASINTVMKMTDTTIASDPDTIAALALSPDPILNFTPSIRPPPQPPPQEDGGCFIPPGSTVDHGILL
jgi:hypothetical protein